jgi:hypothetical protein
MQATLGLKLLLTEDVMKHEENRQVTLGYSLSKVYVRLGYGLG